MQASTNEDLGYPIVIGEDLRDEIARFGAKSGPVTAVLADANPRLREIAAKTAAVLAAPRLLAFELGERRKRLATAEHVMEEMRKAGVERGSLVMGVGGGVASDLFGFVCATYMRGIRYAHVATSLVAMVDAAIGGKTGVNLPGGKNLAGVFRDPVGVFCDVGALETLSPRALREGLAEIVKAAIIEGGDFFELLEELAAHRLTRWPWQTVIEQAVKVKTMTVADDRLEKGIRELLNLGHTFGHAIERASKYRTPHGAAVAVGLRGAGLLALQTGRFSEAEHLRVLTLLTLLGLPLETRLDADAVFDAMSSDKKRRGARLRFVLPRAIGDVEYGVCCDSRSVRAVLARLREPPSHFERNRRTRARR